MGARELGAWPAHWAGVHMVKKVVKKKAGSSKSGTGTKKKLGEYSDFEVAPFVELLSDTGAEQLASEALSVNCRFCNTDLVHLNFEWTAVPTHTITVGSIKSAIRQRHGGSVSLVDLYLNFAHPDHRLVDVLDGTTLAELGIEGEIPGVTDKLPEVLLYYDFPPETQFYDEPLVYMQPNVAVPVHPVPPPTLKQRVVKGASIEV